MPRRSRSPRTASPSTRPPTRSRARRNCSSCRSPLSQTEVEYHLVWRVRVRTEDPARHLGHPRRRPHRPGILAVQRHALRLQRHVVLAGAVSTATVTAPSPRPAQYLRVQVTGVGNGQHRHQRELVDQRHRRTPHGHERTSTGPTSTSTTSRAPRRPSPARRRRTSRWTVASPIRTPRRTSATPSTRSTRSTTSSRSSRPGSATPIPGSRERESPLAPATPTGTGRSTSTSPAAAAPTPARCSRSSSTSSVTACRTRSSAAQGNQGLGEGNGDILGNLMTQDPIIGRGFYIGQLHERDPQLAEHAAVPGRRGRARRSTTPARSSPASTGTSMVLLQAQYGESIRDVQVGATMAQRPHAPASETQPDQVLSAFIADDDNGNLDDGTPHHDDRSARRRRTTGSPARRSRGRLRHALDPALFGRSHRRLPAHGDHHLVARRGRRSIVPRSVLPALSRRRRQLYQDVPMTATGEPG